MNILMRIKLMCLIIPARMRQSDEDFTVVTRAPSKKKQGEVNFMLAST